jgi:hypothetical protein
VMMKICSHCYGVQQEPTGLTLTHSANAANSSSEATRNMTMAAAAAYTTGANFASGGSGLLDSTVYLIHLTLLLLYF